MNLEAIYSSASSHFPIMVHLKKVCTAHCGKTNGLSWLKVVDLGSPSIVALSSCPEGQRALESWCSWETNLTLPVYKGDTSVLTRETQRGKVVCSRLHNELVMLE